MDCQHIRTAIDTASRFEPMGESAQRHLRSCGGCRDYADEMSSFLSLLKSTPRVTAPADFDFRLRARIAEAQAKRRNPFSFLEGFWSLSFSWGQTATAMATIALVATLGTFYFVRQKPITYVTPDQVAAKVETPKVTDSTLTVKEPTSAQALETHLVTPGVVAVSNHPGRINPRNTGWKRTEQLEPVTGVPVVMAGQQIIVKNPDGTKRMLTVPDATYGAQIVVRKPEKALAANSQTIF